MLESTCARVAEALSLFPAASALHRLKLRTSAETLIYIHTYIHTYISKSAKRKRSGGSRTPSSGGRAARAGRALATYRFAGNIGRPSHGRLVAMSRLSEAAEALEARDGPAATRPRLSRDSDVARP